MKYYIMDTRQVVGNLVLWWAKDRHGYTTELESAGLYDLEKLRETDVFVPEHIARNCSVTHVRIETLREALKEYNSAPRTIATG